MSDNTDVPTFRDVFKRITGMTLGEYKNKYNREADIF